MKKKLRIWDVTYACEDGVERKHRIMAGSEGEARKEFATFFTKTLRGMIHRDSFRILRIE